LYRDNTAENLQDAESRIRDVDIAEEMMRFSRFSLLEKVSESLLAQANQMPNGVLNLLQ
jgi:flagellin